MIFLLIGLLSWSPPLAAAQDYSIFLGKKAGAGKLESWEMHSNIPSPENGKVYFVTVYSMNNKFSPMGASVVYHEQSESFEILSGHILLGAEGAVPSQPNIGPVKPGHIYFRDKSPQGGKVNSGPMPSHENPSIEREVPRQAPDSSGKIQVETKGGKNTSTQASNADSQAAPAQPKKPSSGIEQSLSNAAKAGVTAGVVTGISRGVILTPKDQRELADLQKQIDASADRMQQGEVAFALETAVWGKELAEGGRNFEAAVEGIQSLTLTAVESPDAFYASKAGKKVAKAREDLQDFEPIDQAGEGLKEFGLAAADASEEAFLGGSYGESEQFADLAEATAGIALGLNPVTSLVQDGFELFTGRNFITGRALSDAERAMAGVGFVAGLASGGVGSSLVKATATAGKMMVRQGHVASAVMKNVALKAGKLVPFPADGQFARVMQRKYAEKFLRGSGSLAPPNADVAMVAAFEDVEKYAHKGQKLSRRLGLHPTGDTSRYIDLTDDYVLVKFKFDPSYGKTIRAPRGTEAGVDFTGFVTGGVTSGGAREWKFTNVFHSDSIFQKGSVEIVELK